MHFYKQLSDADLGTKLPADVHRAANEAAVLAGKELGIGAVRLIWFEKVLDGTHFDFKSATPILGEARPRFEPGIVRVLLTDNKEQAVSVVAHETMHLAQFARGGYADAKGIRAELEAGRFEGTFATRFFGRKVENWASGSYAKSRAMDELKNDLAALELALQ